MKIINPKNLFLIIIGIGVFMHLYQFGSLPMGLNRDEAALGYNAFAISTEGTDEWGKPWPLIFKSFGDYKLPGYIYTLVPLVKVFGTHDWVIRLPSLLSGLLQIYLVYRLSLEFVIYKSKMSKKLDWLALLPAALLSISPWHLYYSRVAFEANLGLTLLLISLLLILAPYKLRNLVLITLSYLASCLTYNTPLLLAPVIIIFIWLLPDKSYLVKLKLSAIYLIVFVVMIYLLTPLTQQKQNITIFSDPTIKAFQLEAYAKSSNLIQRIENHHIVNYVRIATINWFKTFSPSFLVIRGGSHPWHTITGIAHLSWSTYLLGLFGLIYLFYKTIIKLITKQSFINSNDQHHLALLWLTIAAPIPSIVTVDAPHATRSLLLLLLFPVIAIIGINYLLTRKKAYLFRIIVPIVLCILILDAFKLSYYLFIKSPNIHTNSWPYNLAQIIREAINKADHNQAIVFLGERDEMTNEQLYIHVLLETNTKPSVFNKNVSHYPPDTVWQNRIKSFDRFKFLNFEHEIPYGSIIVKRTDSYEYYLEN